MSFYPDPLWGTAHTGGAWSDPVQLKDSFQDEMITTGKPALLSLTVPPDGDHAQAGVPKLWCVHPGGTNGALLHTGTTDGSTWDTDTYLPRSHTADGPALAAFQSRVECLHTNAGGFALHHTHAVPTPGKSGEPPRLRWHLDGSRSIELNGSQAPALGVIDGKLLCLYTVPDQTVDPVLTYSVRTDKDGAWAKPQPACRGHGTVHPPALAALHGRLVAAWHGNYTVDQRDDPLLWSTFDGSTWSYPKTARTQQGSPLAAGVRHCALAAVGDTLACVFTTPNPDPRLHHTVMHVPHDGGTPAWDSAYWTGPVPITTATGDFLPSHYGPALTAHNGTLHCVFGRTPT